MIQKQIYLSTRKYRLSYIYKLQKYLLNSNEAKLISINKILDNIFEYYNNYNKEKYLIKNYNKFFLFKFLFELKFYCNKINNQIIKNIHQHIIFLCIKPEWKAKFSINIERILSKEKLNLDIDSSFIEFKIKTKFIDKLKFQSLKYSYINKILSKLKSSNYITKLIKSWLYINSLINLSHLYNLNNFYLIQANQMHNYFHFNSLYILIFNILKIDLKWYSFYLFKQSFILNKIKKVIISINNENKLVEQFNYNNFCIYLIKYFLYKKYYFTSKIISSLNKDTILLQINKLVQNYYSNHFKNISISRSISINEILNINLYYWLKKQYKINLYLNYSNNLKISNYLLNIYIYNTNIKNLYLDTIYY